MTPSDFDALYKSLGLTAVPKGVDSETTFVPVSGEDTLTSVPKEELHPLGPAASASLPTLHFASPDAARSGGDEPDLMPVQVLGEGGMGRVLLANQTALGRHVAVKVLKPSLANAAAAAALVQEARTAGGLEHPGVVPIYALARDAQGLPALVMKRVEGLSWRELMHTPDYPAWAKLLPSSPDRLAFHIEVLVQVCNAVAHAHQRGVLHRDVKPDNVLLGELGEVYLADWGVAATKSTVAPSGERVALVGTPAYLAPEMVTGETSKMDERTDVYLLGATLHEVLTGDPPHVADELRDALQHAFLSHEPVLPPGTPPLLAAACKRALAADPARRFQSATALRDELKRFLQHRSSSALAQAAAERLRELEATPDTAGSPFDERRWNALVFECRFGFTQALKDSPDHDEARDGLRRCLEVAARHEIALEHPAAARAFLSELQSPPAALLQALQDLEAKEAQRSADVAKLRRLTHELDPQVSVRQRTRLLLGMGGATLVLATVVALAGSDAPMFMGYHGWIRLVGMSLVYAAYLIAAVVGRRSLFSTRLNRELMALVGVAGFTALAHRAVSVVFDAPLPVTVAGDALIIFAFCAFGALTFHRTFVIPALFFLGCTVGTALFPARALNIFGLTAALAFGSFPFVFSRWRKAAGRRPPEG